MSTCRPYSSWHMKRTVTSHKQMFGAKGCCHKLGGIYQFAWVCHRHQSQWGGQKPGCCEGDFWQHPSLPSLLSDTKNQQMDREQGRECCRSWWVKEEKRIGWWGMKKKNEGSGVYITAVGCPYDTHNLKLNFPLLQKVCKINEIIFICL